MSKYIARALADYKKEECVIQLKLESLEGKNMPKQ
jgi:hypothetical protein